MDPMNLISGMLADKMGVDAGAAQGALGTLMSAGGGGAASLDGSVGGLLAAFKERGLGEGDMSADKLRGLFGGESVSEAAGLLGASEDGLLGTLQEMLPGLLGKLGMGGDVMDKLGGAAALGGMAKKFL